MRYKRSSVCEWKNVTKRITYSSESLKLAEWAYGKWWYNMDWYVFCGMECGTLCDVDTARYVVVWWRYARCHKWWDCVESGGVLMCDVECYMKHGSGMWNWVWSRSAVVEWCTEDVVRCIKDVANIWRDLNVAWSTWNVALCQWYVSNVKWGAMRDVVWCIMWLMWCRIWNMVLQSGIVCCKRCWCNMKCAIWWEMVWRGMCRCGLECQRCFVWCGMMRCKMWW